MYLGLDENSVDFDELSLREDELLYIILMLL